MTAFCAHDHVTHTTVRYVLHPSNIFACRFATAFPQYFKLSLCTVHIIDPPMTFHCEYETTKWKFALMIRTSLTHLMSPFRMFSRVEKFSCRVCIRLLISAPTHSSSLTADSFQLGFPLDSMHGHTETIWCTKKRFANDIEHGTGFMPYRVPYRESLKISKFTRFRAVIFNFNIHMYVTMCLSARCLSSKSFFLFSFFSSLRQFFSLLDPTKRSPNNDFDRREYLIQNFLAERQNFFQTSGDAFTFVRNTDILAHRVRVFRGNVNIVIELSSIPLYIHLQTFRGIFERSRTPRRKSVIMEAHRFQQNFCSSFLTRTNRWIRISTFATR